MLSKIKKSILILALPLIFLCGNHVRAESALENANLWSAPTPANLYQSILYTEGAENGVKEVSISWSSMRLYAEGSEDSDNNKVYDYTNLNTSSQETAAGTLLYNRIRVLTERDFLVTQTVDDNLWGKIFGSIQKVVKNQVTAVATGFGVIFGYIGATLTDLMKSLLNFGGKIVSTFTPIGIFGLGKTSVETLSRASDSGWIDGVVSWLSGVVIGDTSSILNQVTKLALLIWIVVAGVTILVNMMKGNLSGVGNAFKRLFFRFTIPIIFLASIPTWNSTMENLESLKTDLSNGSTQGLQSIYVVDATKLFVASNGSLSLMYPDSYSSLSSDNKDDLSQFKTTPSDIQRINDMISHKLGDDLNEELTGDNSELSIFTAILNGDGVVDVSQYIDGIETAASKGVNVPATKALGSTIEGTEYKFTVPAIGDWQDNMGADKNGKIATGRPYFIDNIVTKSDSKELSDANLKRRRLHSSSIGALQSDGKTERRIAYNSDNFKFVRVSPKKSWTYLYGIKSSNSYTTANLANYTMSSGNTITKDPTGKVGNNNDPSDDEDTSVGLTAEEAKEVLWRNAYDIAIFNKYTGMTEEGPKDSGGSFSNQSMAMLLQSTFSSSGVKYNGYYANYSDADKGKVVTANNNVGYVRYTIPNSGTNDYLSKVNTLSFTYVATAILIGGVAIAIFKTSVIGFLKDEWVFFVRTLTHASLSAMMLFYITDLAIRTVFSIADIIEILLEQMIAKIAVAMPANLSGTPFAAGIVLIGAAIAMSLPLIKFGNRKASFVEIILNLFLVFIQQLRKPLMKLDDAIYGQAQYQGQFDSAKPLSDKNKGDFGLKLAGGAALAGGVKHLLKKASALPEDDTSDDNDNNGSQENGQPSGNSRRNMPLSQKVINKAKRSSRLMSTAVKAMALGTGTLPLAKGAQKALKLGHKLATGTAGAKLGLQGRTAQLIAKYGAKGAYDIFASGDLREPKTVKERQRRADFLKNYKEYQALERTADAVFLGDDNNQNGVKTAPNAVEANTNNADSQSKPYTYTKEDRDEFLRTDERAQELRQKMTPYEIGGRDLDNKIAEAKAKVTQPVGKVTRVTKSITRKGLEKTLDNRFVTKARRVAPKVQRTAVPLARVAKKMIKK